MAFGIEIINNNDRIIIDNNYSNFGYFSLNPSAAAAGSNYPGVANTVGSDFIVARANTTANGFMSIGIGASGNNVWLSSGQQRGANSAIYYVLRNNTRFINPQTSGYALEVYANTGNVIFTANITKNFEIIAVGTLNSFTSNTMNIAFPSTTTWYSDFTKYFVVMNNTFSFYLPHAPPLVTGLDWKLAYRYLWANSTHGRIFVECNSQGTTANPTPLGGIDIDFHYMILKEIT